MSGVDGVSSRRRTEELVDDWAHDAGIAGKDEHVKGRAGLRSSSEVWEARKEATAGEAVREVASGLAKELGPELLDHAVVEGHGALALRAAQVEKGTTKLVEQLKGKDAALVPILQARADEGFIVQQRAHEATKSLGNTPARAEAMQNWMKDNGFEDRRRNDVAFGKGAEYFEWVSAQPKSAHLDVCAESKKVHARQAPTQPFACRG